MSYGIRFEDIRVVRTPAAEELGYGSRTVCTGRPEYSLERLVVRARSAVPARYYPAGRGVYFVESGELQAFSRDAGGEPSVVRLKSGCVFPVTAAALHGFLGGAGDSVLYFFSNRDRGECRTAETPAEATRAWRFLADDFPGRAIEGAGRTSDFREKYWGTIETIVDDDFAGKRIFLREGGQSSLEFHTHKVESYFLHSGKVRVGLRTGRAENRSVILTAGQSFDVPPGLMHMRMALADSVIIEISTRDADSDSHLVEDGMKYKHVDIDDPTART
ncbi:MAG: hypothetical protein JOZ69_11320 [Myxococcales bacterium]|nr:hypothetical protein [Myxococcales bacterium]